ncbi:hypothetical protein AVEN_141669-1 [Araneus ventricosus]|uniref:Uncharacterized protein n=1 Tax=Araneus ventricosus TaxID=182803 RepID=A0A4Y2VLM4_ARAVE|nr:hypothetical protein AVEN_9502-1 [Araneus ventricosus]GBO25518.1 hypothetical protein AVEN_141669-1 [Araneus ventricosus]
MPPGTCEQVWNSKLVMIRRHGPLIALLMPNVVNNCRYWKRPPGTYEQVWNSKLLMIRRHGPLIALLMQNVVTTAGSGNVPLGHVNKCGIAN